MLQQAYGEDCLSRAHCHEWYQSSYVQMLLQTVCEVQLAHGSEWCEAGCRRCGKWPGIIFILAI